MSSCLFLSYLGKFLAPVRRSSSMCVRRVTSGHFVLLAYGIGAYLAYWTMFKAKGAIAASI